VRVFTSRVIGGQIAPEDAYGDFVLLLNEVKYMLCGGTLIQENLVLTAAHCVENLSDAKKVKYVAKGSIRYDEERNRLESADAISEAVEFFIHPKYRIYDGNDIAIIRLETKNPLPPPFVKLAKGTELAMGTTLTAVGFGDNSENMVDYGGYWKATNPPVLYEVDLQLRAPGDAPCPRRSKKPRRCDSKKNKIDCYAINPKKEFCVVGEWYYGDNLNTETGAGIKDVCSGDSGGPLYYKGVQYGIAEKVLDKELCQKYFTNPFTVFTKVSAHRRFFIDRIVKKNPYKGEN
jgi:secreted trypsin-like serine protease